MKRLRVCGRSKQKWSDGIAAELTVKRGCRRRYGRTGECMRERYSLCSMIQEGKREYWEAFRTASGEKSPLGLVRWVKDP